ncbi:MAG TPA: aldose 1-epimerase [Burkholderiaceae bacterium]|nr:aldose 1-epimerase [Burkholderiaceae bacterium]
MTSTLQLASGQMRCVIVPELGACISGLWLGDTPVLRSLGREALTSARQAGCYALVPFSNRVAHATLKWQGTSHPLVQTSATEPHAIHGVGWQRPWGVLEQEAHFAMLAYEHKADASWPFAFDSSQTFRLSGNALELTLSITNQSATAAPVGLGWHPYFVKRGNSHIAFDATGRWEMGTDKLPTHRVQTTGLDADCALLEVDHCFDGWNGTVHLRDEALLTRIDANLGRLVVFTNETRDFVAIEPVSHVNNAINLMETTGAQADDLGVRVLQAGESMSAQMTITVESVK